MLAPPAPGAFAVFQLRRRPAAALAINDKFLDAKNLDAKNLDAKDETRPVELPARAASFAARKKGRESASRHFKVVSVNRSMR